MSQQWGRRERRPHLEHLRESPGLFGIWTPQLDIFLDSQRTIFGDLDLPGWNWIRSFCRCVLDIRGSGGPWRRRRFFRWRRLIGGLARASRPNETDQTEAEDRPLWGGNTIGMSHCVILV